FQAEDGIRDFHVTGVQTCALPIYEFMRQNPNASYLQQQQYFLENTSALKSEIQNAEKLSKAISDYSAIIEKEYPTLDRTKVMERSEERRVGKECRDEL